MLIDNFLAKSRPIAIKEHGAKTANDAFDSVIQQCVVYKISERAFHSIKELVAFKTEAKPPHKICWFECAKQAWVACCEIEFQIDEGGVTPPKPLGTDLLLQAIFAALESKSCQMEKHEPDAALQKARKRRGKAPLRDYTYVDLSPSPPHEAGDGTRGPFRRHPVRGHWRAVEGRAIYVKPHWRGCLGVGMAPLRRKVM
jgi:hypothetical protein